MEQDPSAATAAAAVAAVIATTVATMVATLVLAKKILYPTREPVIPSPLAEVLSGGDPSAVEGLDYHPDEFPGARDVDTPYGPIHVYEFGPETGKKVLFIHGISTSCMTLSRLARSLSSASSPLGGGNHRVLLFDLFGRGFSSTPSDLPHDSRLYVTQILLALASSPLAWLGTAGMSVVGYSMGGALAVSFATSFPHVVDSLVLLAPAGLIREENFGAASRILFQSGWVPPRLLEAMTKKRLRKPIAGSVKRAGKGRDDGNSNGGVSSSAPHVHASGPGHIRDEVVTLVEGETIDPVSSPSASPNAQQQSGSSYPPTNDPLEQAVVKHVHWMLDHHEGFVPAFVSCVASAPLMNQHHLWIKLGEQARSTDPEYFPRGVAVLLGRDDEIVDARDYEVDGKPLLFGKDEDAASEKKIVWKVVGGGHNFPMTNANEALDAIYQAWGITPPDKP